MSLASLTDDDLNSVLIAYGYEDLLTLPRGEKEEFVQSLSGGNEEIVTSTQSDEANTRDSAADQPQQSIHHTNPQDHLNSDSASSEINAETSESNNEETASSSNANQESIITQFCDLTGCERAYASTFLEAMAWNLETAVSLHIGGDLSRTNSFNVASAISSTGIPNPPIGIEGTGFQFPPRPHIASGDAWNLRMMARRHDYHDMEMGDDDEDDEYYDGSNHAEYDEEGIRRPDPVRMQRLISSHSFSRSNFERSVLGRADDPNADWLFPPPRHLSSQESFEEVRELGITQKRWLLVNIQSHEEFPSQLLNRDTWPNDALAEMLRTTYIFWQRGHTTLDGKDFIRLYHVNVDTLPQIFIIDPRTGAKLFTWTGFVEPEELILKLADFADSHSLDSMVTKAVMDEKNANTPTNEPIKSDGKETKEAEQLSAKEVAEVSRPAAQDYGLVPAVPADNDTSAIKISIRLGNGKTISRKYNRSDPVRVLFAVAYESDAENTKKTFDLISRFPALTLSTCLDKTLDECGLAGGSIMHRWL